MLIVGLTGGIGAGKSTAACILESKGAVVIDVDAIGRAVLSPGGRAEAAVIAEFGSSVVGADGAIDRAVIAKIVFVDQNALTRLTAITHKHINEELVATLSRLSPDKIVILDMAILAESELGRSDSQFHYTFVVTIEAPPALREERAVARGSDRDDVRRRMAQQATDKQRRSIADVVLTNDGSPEHLAFQLDELWDLLVGLSLS